MKSRLKFLVIIAISLLIYSCIFGDKTAIATTVTISDRQILVDGMPFTIKGVGYAPVPIGIEPETTFPYGDDFTSNYASIYNRDLPLLRQMGANTIRLWGWNNTADHTDFLNKAYNDGTDTIHVIVTFWMGPSFYPDISSPTARAQIKANFRNMVASHKNHPAVLMWAIGNELNAPWMYGNNLSDLFSLINEMAQEAHLEEGANYHPVTTPLADVNLINTIATYDSNMANLDVWSLQVYRGQSFGSLFRDYANVSGKPLVITEYGIDAYDNRNGDEYEKIGIPYQAKYAESLWNEITANSNVSAGASIMAYSDEWWKGKYGPVPNPNAGCPESNASYHSNCGYPTNSHPDGYSNEEWWGIMRTKDNGSYPDILESRAVYYTLQSLWTTKAAITNISSCTSVFSPGTYVLNKSIINSNSAKCINITANNVIFDGAGYTIDGVDTANTYGVYVYNSTTKLTNITVKNLIVTDWDYGIYYYNSTNGRIKNSTANSNNGPNSLGISLSSSDYNELSGNNASNNNYGIRLYYSSNNMLSSNNASNNNYRGIYLSYSRNNTIYNNYFSNINNAWDNGNNSWNTTKQSGTNTIGGAYLGGNYWSDYAGNDTDGDGLGDTLIPYKNSGNITYGGDYLPLTASTPTILPKITILSPKENDTVSWRHIVKGTSIGVYGSNLSTYVLIYPIEANGPWFVQPEVSISPNGNWETNAYFGRDPAIYPENNGKHFKVSALITAVKLIEGQQLEKIPDNVYRVDIKEVVRGGSTSSDSSSGGSGGGGGGGDSNEPFTNIELKEKYDLYIFKDKTTSYAFANPRNPILFVNITGNVSAGDINTAVEALRSTSSLVNYSAPGKVYKNVNIWVGTSGFATSKNIKEAVIRFRVNNSWISSNNLAGSDIRMVRWDGSSKWVELETAEKTKDNNNTYFEAKTDRFSSFAITGMEKAVQMTTPIVTITSPEPTATVTMIVPEAKPPRNWAIIIGIFLSLLAIVVPYMLYLKRK